MFVESIDVQRGNRITRSQSCPELTLFSYKSPLARRKRARSEVFFSNEIDDDFGERIDFKALHIQSRHSESNLMRIDKEKTFQQQQNSIDDTTDVLAKVVFALNSLHKTIEKAPVAAPSFDGKTKNLSDENILEDEEWSMITAPSNDSKMLVQKKSRSRARSLYPQISKNFHSSETNSSQFTWAGNNNDIQNYINAQVKNGKNRLPPAKKEHCGGVLINIDKSKDGNDSTTATTMRRKSIFSVFNNVFRRRNTSAAMISESAVEQINPARLSLASKKLDAIPDYVRRSSILSNQSSSRCSEQVLENTTIADLIRAIENVHVENLNSRRISMVAPSSVRRDSNTPSPSIKSNRSNSHRLSVAIPHSRMIAMRQNSKPNRFSVVPVNESAPLSVPSLSPIVQRRLQQFSTVSATTMMPQHKFSSSLQTSPLVTRRTQFKPAISPLAMQPTMPIRSIESDMA